MKNREFIADKIEKIVLIIFKSLKFYVIFFIIYAIFVYLVDLFEPSPFNGVLVLDGLFILAPINWIFSLILFFTKIERNLINKVFLSSLYSLLYCSIYFFGSYMFPVTFWKLINSSSISSCLAPIILILPIIILAGKTIK